MQLARDSRRVLDRLLFLATRCAETSSSFWIRLKGALKFSKKDTRDTLPPRAKFLHTYRLTKLSNLTTVVINL